MLQIVVDLLLLCLLSPFAYKVPERVQHFSLESMCQFNFISNTFFIVALHREYNIHAQPQNYATVTMPSEIELNFVETERIKCAEQMKL